MEKGSELLSWRFGSGRKEVSWPVRIKASPNLNQVKEGQIDVTTSHLVREDNHETFPAPTFTQPRFTRDGQFVTFTVCAKPGGAQPGNYTGSVLVDGPPRVTGARLAIQVTAKAGNGTFVPVLLGAFFVALGALTLKGIGDYSKVRQGTKGEFNFRHAFLFLWRSPDRAITTLLGLGAALLAALLLYHKSDTWGADTLVDALAVVQAAITAVGAQALLDGPRKANV